MYGININKPERFLSSSALIYKNCLCVLNLVTVYAIIIYCLGAPRYYNVWYTNSFLSVNKDYLGASQQPNERCTWVFFSVTAWRVDVFVAYKVSAHHCVHLTLSSSKEIDFIFSVAYLPLQSLHWDGWLFILPSLWVFSHVWGWRTQHKCMRDSEQDRGWKSSWNHSRTS